MGLIKNHTCNTNYITPEMFGAVGNGADDTYVVQQAINYATEHKKTVLLTGIYNIVSTLNVTCSIKNEGELHYYGSDSSCLFINATDNIEITGGIIKSCNSGFAHELIEICNSSHITIKARLSGYSSESGRGVYIYNKSFMDIDGNEFVPQVSDCKIDVDVYNFYIGVHCEARESSIHFCKFNVHTFHCMYGVYLGNTFYNESHDINITGEGLVTGQYSTYLYMTEKCRYNKIKLNCITPFVTFNADEKTAIIEASNNTIELISSHNIIDDYGKNFYIDTPTLSRSDSCVINPNTPLKQVECVSINNAEILTTGIFSLPKDKYSFLEYDCKNVYNAGAKYTIHFEKFIQSGYAHLSRIRFDTDPSRLPKRVILNVINIDGSSEECELMGERINNNTINLNHVLTRLDNVQTLEISFIGAVDLSQTVKVFNVAVESLNIFGDINSLNATI